MVRIVNGEIVHDDQNSRQSSNQKTNPQRREIVKIIFLSIKILKNYLKTL
jgi:hypothetical protein